jgi:MoaA/NifB/PqqE/SkfB family radical SAM enzyme
MSVRFLQIEPTTRCNFTCGFCCGRSMRQGDLAFETFEAILAQFPDLVHVELQGEGEPLMHPRFFDMAALARSRGIAVSIISNGSHFTAETVSRILDIGLEQINVSLESADFGMFRQIRGGKLEKVIRGLELLVAERAARKLDRPVIGFAVTVLKQTLDARRGIIALYRRLGLDGGITFQLLQRMASYMSCYDTAMTAQAVTAAEAEEYERATSADPELRAIVRAAWRNGFYPNLYKGWSPATGTCPWLEHGGFVNIDGDVMGCCSIKDAQQFSFGRIGVASAAQIDSARDQLRDELWRNQIPKACQNCSTGEQAVRRS